MKTSMIFAVAAMTIASAIPAAAQTRYFARSRLTISPASNGQTPPAAPRCPMSFVTGISLGNGQHASVLGTVPNDGTNRLPQIQALCDTAPSATTSCVAYPVSNGQPITVYGYTQPTSGGGSANGDYRRAWANCS